jgi:hypothetical protein
MGEAIHLGRRALGGADHFLRTDGPGMKQLALGIAPAIARSNPALAAGIATVGQAADGYSQLRTQLGD